VKRHFNSILILLLVLFLFPFWISCNNKEEKKSQKIVLDSLIYKDDSKELFTGRMKKKVGNKTIEYDVVNGRKHGNFMLYYETGKIEIEGTIENNKNAGLWRYYYPNGQIESEGYFKNDLVDGKWVWYYENGKVKEISEYIEGKRNGKSSLYDEKGTSFLKNFIKMTKFSMRNRA
jgi:antitoxin component YwqK of YwqJK toxin-antitoxin module